MLAVDESKLNAFMGQFAQDLGATVQAGMVVLGHRLGLYRAMAGAGPLSPAELADPAGPVYLPGAFQLALASLRAEPRIAEAFRTGAGVGSARPPSSWPRPIPTRAWPGSTTTSGPSTGPARPPPRPVSRTGPLRGRPGRRLRRDGYDLVATFDCFHDMGDPAGAAAHIRRAAETPFNLVYEVRA